VPGSRGIGWVVRPTFQFIFGRSVTRWLDGVRFFYRSFGYSFPHR
jgi:hypothetical protein